MHAGIVECIKFLFSIPVGLPALEVITGAFDSKIKYFCASSIWQLLAAIDPWILVDRSYCSLYYV